MDEEWDQFLGLYVSQLPSEVINCALKKAFWNHLASWVNGDNSNLLSLDQYMLSTQLTHWHDLGVKTVTVDQIRGYVGRSHEVDKSLTPRQEQIQHQWISVDRARFHNAASPLIDLLKIGDIYFVLDGHHRLSVASIHHQESIKAHVIEVEEDHEC